jgi:GH25 family lysozyme M1 (1,4-beta-N-acetylmuramidase)
VEDNMVRPVGVDISKWQAHSDLSKPHGVDFVKLHDKADFIFLRAGYGGSSGGAWTDERVHAYMQDLAPLLQQNPKPFTLYWYFRDDVSVMEQASRFADVVNRWKHVINLDLVVDAEVFVKSDLLSTQKIIDYQTTVETLTGLKVDILYGRAAQLNAETTPGLEEVLPHLWIARYASFLDEQVDEPWEEGDNVDPRDYEDWLFWQYSASGGGADYGVVSASIDRNVFNGTLEELRALAKLDQPAPPDEDDDDWAPIQDMKVQEETLTSAQSYISSFKPPSDYHNTPAFISLAFPRGEVGIVKIIAVIGGVPFQVFRLNCKYRDWVFKVFPMMYFQEGDIVLVEVNPIVETTVSVGTAWK